MIREWAVANGHMRPESRGRIPGAIVEMYENAQQGTQTSDARRRHRLTPLAKRRGVSVAATFVDDKGRRGPDEEGAGRNRQACEGCCPEEGGGEGAGQGVTLLQCG
jgi:hypothetical protein